ncbi:MAG: 3-phosphoglycerate dehydrogenase, partial [Alistipes sp.]|nr:3-phosphoglycerate dehydrogenase [Alistipes sp.]
DAAKNLKIVVRAGAGYDNVDLAACTARGIVVMNTPGQNSNAVAELAIGMMIMMARNQYTPGTGTELKGKRLGIHAYGNVGRLVGTCGKALGMEVSAYDPFITDAAYFEAEGVRKVDSVEELYSTADYVSIHIPATPQTKGSIGYELLSKMPKGATIINTARKEVIDEAGLMQVLAEREDLKYATDVAADSQAELNEMFGKRVFGTPKKMGAETAEANINAGLAAARQVVGYLRDGITKFQVNK